MGSCISRGILCVHRETADLDEDSQLQASQQELNYNRDMYEMNTMNTRLAEHILRRWLTTKSQALGERAGHPVHFWEVISLKFIFLLSV